MNKSVTSRFFLAALVAATTFIIFVPALHNGFLEWDDGGYVVENYHIRSFDAAFFKWAFLDFYKSNWHPLTWMSHALDYALWGLNPLGHHLTSVLLHAINTLLVVLLTMRLVDFFADTPREQRPSRSAHGRTALISGGVTGLLFGLHPLHVESVAWVAERKDLLCALFFLLSIMAYTRYAAQARGAGQWARTSLFRALCFFALALLSKPMAVSLPAVLLLLDWFPFRRIRSLKTFGAALAEKLPFIALSFLSSAVTILAQIKGHSIAPLEAVPFSQRILVAAHSLVVYLLKMVAPLNLIPFYPYAEHLSLFSPEYGLPVVLLVGLAVSCVWKAREHEVWTSVWVYYFITLLPTLGLVQVGSQSMADRYTYLPSLGPFLAAGLGAAALWTRIDALTSWGKVMRTASTVLAVVLLVSLSLLTRTQIAIWKDSISLWSYVIEKEPERVPRAYHNRANAYYKMGLLDEAVSDYDKAIALNPSLYEAYANLGILYGSAGLADKALYNFDKSLAINPEYSFGYGNRGITYAALGQYDRALKDFNKAIQLSPNYANAYYNRGDLFLRAGQKEFAVPDFQKACALGNRNACRALGTYGP